jgi:hypothetical protein
LLSSCPDCGSLRRFPYCRWNTSALPRGSIQHLATMANQSASHRARQSGNCLSGKKWLKLRLRPGVPVRLPWQRVTDERGRNSGKPPARSSFLGMEEVRGSIPLRSTNATARTPFGAFFFEWRHSQDGQRIGLTSRCCDSPSSPQWKWARVGVIWTPPGAVFSMIPSPLPWMR